MDSDDIATLAAEFAALGAQLRGRLDSDDVLDRMMDVVVKQVSGCEHASVSDAQARSIAASDGVAQEADRLQHQLGEGPCLQAALDGDDFYSFDVADDQRWPQYARALQESTPVRSVLAFPLREEKAALNLFGDVPGAFDDDALTAAAVVAALAGGFLSLRRAEHQSAHLEAALANSRVIGAAIGIVMQTRRVTREAAFEVLRSTSQDLHRKLRDVADHVVETGEVPEDSRLSEH
ncbi:ANTAR domain-containing protein [Jatrophihabitans fulvus]